MPRFEVHIPSAGEASPNVTLRVDADHWMAALRTGLDKLGEQGSSVQNVLVDIQGDGSVHVTESQTGRVFEIREIVPAAPRPPAREDQAPTLPNLPAPPPMPSHQPRSAGAAKSESGGKEFPPGSARPIGRTLRKDKEKRADIEDGLAEVFERVQDVHSCPSEGAALEFLLDLALEKIPAESGAVLRANAGTGHLTFVSARGPKATELLQARIVIPAGVGIAGFCAAEGASVALSDVQRDPRWFSEVSERLRYETKSVLCAPMMTHGRSFGCMELINRRGTDAFTEHEIGMLAYIAHQGALYLNSKT
jgi:hypothetical protein